MATTSVAAGSLLGYVTCLVAARMCLPVTALAARILLAVTSEEDRTVP